MKRISIIALVAMVCTMALAKDIKRPDSYNYQRGIEAVENRNYEEAMKYLKAELDDNPKNGYAWAWILAVNINKEEYGEAITAGLNALKLLPKRDGYFIGYVHKSLTNAYYSLGETDKALHEISEAIKADPDDIDYIAMRGYLYGEKELYDLAIKDYETYAQEEPGKAVGYMGLGSIFLSQKRYDEAIEKFSYAIKLDKDFSTPYVARADCYMKKGDNIAAAKDLVAAFDIDESRKAFSKMQECNDTCYQSLVILLDTKCAKGSMDKDWHYILAVVHQRHNRFAEAIKEYKVSLANDPYPVTAEFISECYAELGNYPMAHQYIDIACEMDSTDTDLIRKKADYYYYSDDMANALEYITRYINADPEFYYGYYRRGFYKDNSRDVEGAITDYTYCITLNPDFSYAYLGRGDMYMLKGETEKARNDYERVVVLDSVIQEAGNCRQYAYLMLGMRDSAEVYMQRILEKYPTASNYYDAACLTARMGGTDRSVNYLEKAFEHGYFELNHLERDDDLDAIRNDARYKELLEKQKKLLMEMNEGEPVLQNTDTPKELQTTEIPFKKESGVMTISCTINSLPLHFIFDTGASEVSISDVEARFMLKNGYLSKKDIIGKAQYQIADGSISEGTVINLKRVVFGGLELTDIKASVVSSQRAPLLLGQSVMNRLGKIEIDNDAKVIKVTRLAETK